MKRSGAFNWWGLAFIACLLGVWQVVAYRRASVIVPGPYEVALAGWQFRWNLLAEISATLWRAFAGFALCAAAIVPLAVVCGRVRQLGRFVDPVFEFLISIPPPAVIPVAMLFAGIGDGAKIAVICYACAPHIFLNAVEGVRNAPPMLNRVARSIHLSRLETMALIDLPAALPAIITGLRIAIGVSLLVSVTSEMLLSTDGIGTFIQRSQESFLIAAGLSGIAVISIAGLIINIVVREIERRMLFWYYRTSSE